MIISLNNDWTVTGTWPFVPLLSKSIESGSTLSGLTRTIAAKVPGGVYHDLFSAGVIDDPLVRDNSLKSEWVENKWWIYKRVFDRPTTNNNDRIFLRFEGLDYIARVYLNGIFMTRHEGTCIPLEIEVTKTLIAKGNVLRVIFEEAPHEVAIGRTSDVQTIKPRFVYKWDFGTRLVNIGIWDDVSLIVTGPAHFLEFQLASDWNGSEGIITINCTSDAMATMRANVRKPAEGQQCGNHNSPVLAEAETMGESHGHSLQFTIKQPELWSPLGYGKQPLYEVELSLMAGDHISETRVFHIGIRSLSFGKNVQSDDSALPYTVYVNKQKVFIKGVNWVPLMHEYGLADEELYKRMLTLARDMGTNLIRVWGGGIIEKEIFYTLCDQLGILVWQEFTQSGAGIESVPREDEEYLNLLAKAAYSAVTRRRNHTSLIIWCGGNELREKPSEDTPVTFNNRNIQLLNDIVSKHDPDRMFYPSSASGPYEFVHEGLGHDVHGFWRYLGVHDHYAMYNKTDYLLHSEHGVDGMSSVESIRLALNSEAPPISNMELDLLWRFHGEWWDNSRICNELFGPFDTLEEFSLASQLIQAEGVRYIVESDIRKSFHCSGTIIWQFNEPWRNISCTNLVEYMGKPKLSYYAVKNSFSQVAASLKYETICPELDTAQRVEIWLSALAVSSIYSVKCRIFSEIEENQDASIDALIPESFDVRTAISELHASKRYREVANHRFEIKVANECAFVSALDFIPNKGLNLIMLETYCGENRVHDNYYFFSTLKEAPFKPLLKLLKEKENGKE